MNLIAEIGPSDLGFENSDKSIKYEIRKAARAVLLNEQNEIAVLFVSKDHYYKLPGGGIEKDETIEEGLFREVDEEVGTQIDIISDIGITLEYRDDFEQLQLSYSYLCKAVGKMRPPQFTSSELEHGFKMEWLPIQEAYKKIKACHSDKYVAKFITRRDSFILEEVIRTKGVYFKEMQHII